MLLLQRKLCLLEERRAVHSEKKWPPRHEMLPHFAFGWVKEGIANEHEIGLQLLKPGPREAQKGLLQSVELALANLD